MLRINYTNYAIIFILALVLFACKGSKEEKSINENQLGFIDADVESEETNMRHKAEFALGQPGDNELLLRSFENAPPLIPHTTEGFFPITLKSNICLSCHLPELADSVGAVRIPEFHFASLRPKMVLKDGVYSFENEGKLHQEKRENLNASFYNCSQCHVPQSKVSIDITNLFTAEFRDKLDLNKSSLMERVDEGTEQ